MAPFFFFFFCFRQSGEGAPGELVTVFFLKRRDDDLITMNLFHDDMALPGFGI